MLCCKRMHIFIFVCIFRSILADIIVNTSSGPVQGISSLSENVEAFLGIPYAEPPVKELRFARPVPKKQWTLIHNAWSLPPPCPQLSLGSYYFYPDVTNMSEDCLYLNIWAPKSMSSGKLKPVIIYIHPGGFFSGSSNLQGHDGSNFASRGDVVVITINYRLGSLGFFMAYTEEAGGSMGMYDQIMAIKWVKENAKLFGGDPENIVLMGASAGAYSISAHMVSPLSKNLFKKAILQSGSMLQALKDNNAVLYENSKKVASFVGCTNNSVTLENNPHSVVTCLKSIPVAKIIEADKSLMNTNIWEFTPRVNDEFLPKSPIDLIREGKFRKDVEVLIGLVKDEGELVLAVALRDYFGRNGGNEVTLSKSRAYTLGQGFLLSLNEPNATAFVRYYMSQVKNRTPIGYSKMLSNIIGDYFISCGTIFLADFLSLKGNSVYFYKFEFRSPSTPMAKWIGTTHLDEVQYVFGSPYHQNFTAEETELSHSMIDRWSAFAKTGNPNIPDHIPWLQYSYHNPLYLSFGQEEENIRWEPLARCEMLRKRYGAVIDTEIIQFLKNSETDAAD